MHWFAIASLSPAIFLAVACLLGGAWPLVALLAITVFVFAVDRWVSRLTQESAAGDGTWVSYLQAIAHFVLWGLGIWAIGTGAHLNPFDKVLLLIGLGLYFGQVSNSNAHELIHKSSRLARRIGVAVYASLLFGHHASAHLRVHHVHAATMRDPNTARLGEGFWRFLIRVWSQEFIAGKQADDTMRMRQSASPSRWSHPYLGYILGGILAISGSAAIAGLYGVLALVVISAYAQVQLYLSDYVQHYGLMRQLADDGRLEPIGPQHSWNAPHWYSSAMMLNAPRHSDHHANPSRAFPALELSRDHMPMLPYSLPVMAVIALIPPLWQHLMYGRAQSWQNRT